MFILISTLIAYSSYMTYRYFTNKDPTSPFYQDSIAAGSEVHLRPGLLLVNDHYYLIWQENQTLSLGKDNAIVQTTRKFTQGTFTFNEVTNESILMLKDDNASSILEIKDTPKSQKGPTSLVLTNNGELEIRDSAGTVLHNITSQVFQG